MKRGFAFAVCVLAAAATAAAQDVDWIQNADGVLLPRGASRNVARPARTARLRIDSASTGAPIRGALAWWIAADAGTPLVTRSNIISDANGTLTVPLFPALLLRIWSEGYEVVELDGAEVASRRELALWPAAPATLHVTGATAPVKIRYFIGARVPDRELASATDASGRISWPGAPRSGIRVEVVDPRFALAAITLHAGDARDLPLQPALRITARVLDDDGRPIPNAKASSFVRMDSAPEDVRRMEWVSGDDGTIAMTGLPTGEHVVDFAADGFVSKSVRVSDQADLGQVRLKRGSPFVLVVRGDDGPLEGATVSVEEGSERLLSDRTGRVTIAGLDTRQQPQLHIGATNYIPATMYVRADMKSPYEVRLHRGSGFRFRLLDAATGDPIEHARVRVHTPGGWSDRSLSGMHGEYFAAGFNAGRMQIRIAASGYLPATVSAGSSGGTPDLGVVFLSRGAVVAGTLVDVQTGRPLVGARVETVPRGRMGTQAARLFGDAIATTTNADGRFELSGLEGGVLCATITHPAVREVPLAVGHIDDNATLDLGVLSIGESSAVEGTLRDSEGAPIRDASVELRFGPVYSPCMAMSGAIDEQGRYRFDRVAAGQYHLIAVRNHEVLGTRAIVVRRGSVAREDLEIRTVAVHGSIVVQGLPAGGGAVMLKHAGSDDFTPPTIFFSYSGPGIDPRQRPVTDIIGKASFSVAADGTFEGKAPLDGGDYEVVWTPADNSAWYHSRVSLMPDATTLSVPLQFNGVPISGSTSPGAFLRLLDGSGREHRTTFAGADGAFVIPNVPAGRWIVDGASKGLVGRKTIDVEAKPPELLKLVLLPAQPSRLTVQIGKDPDAPAIDSVLVTNASGIVRMARADPAAIFDDLPPGSYKVFGVDRHGGIVAGDVVTAGAASSTTTLTSRPTRNVRIRCKNAEPGARVALFSDRYSAVALLAYEGLTLSVLDDGTIALPRLSDGRWTIRIGDRSEEIEVSRDDTFELDD